MATPTETLQAWDTYISEYQANLAAQYTRLDTSNTTQMQEYAIQAAHLTALKRKRQYLQDYYAQYGDLPANVTFDATDAGIALYRRGEGLDPIAVTLIPGRSGETIAQSEDFNLSISFDTAHAGNSAPGANGLSNIGVQYTGADNVWFNTTWADSSGYLTGETANIAHFRNDIFGFGATLNYIPVIASGSRVRLASFGQGILIHLDAATVPTETPWDYYNGEILPDIHPDNAVFPDGYDTTPDKPDPEFPDLPGETENGGPDIEPNDITGIGGGFGFLTQYAIRAQDIEILGKLLWAGFRTGSQQDIDNYLMNFVYNVNADTGSLNFADIMEFFVSLKMYPFPLTNVGNTLTPHDHHIHVGAGYTAIGDNAALPHFPDIIYTMDSYVGKISAGSVKLPFWFRDYRDYSVQITLYLPYCGTVELNPGDVMGGTLDCDYYIDFCTGSCTAYVTCTSWDGHRFPVASMPGQMGADVPMSATNAGRIAARIYSDRIDHVENMVGAFKALTTGAGAVMSGNYAGAVRQGFSAFIDSAINEEKLKAGMLDRGAIAAPVLSAGGGFTSFCNPSTCYVVYRSPFYPEIGNYPDSVGTPAAEQVTIGDCTGFCQFVNVDTSGITTDADTQKQIRDALAAGIYI